MPISSIIGRFVTYHLRLTQSGDAGEGEGRGVTRGDSGTGPAQPKRINTPYLEPGSVQFSNLHCQAIPDLSRTEQRTER
jgi:hypothetical protein